MLWYYREDDMGGPPFDVARAKRLDDPERLKALSPETMLAAAGIEEPRVIVEIGAGTGLITAEFARLAPTATVYAVEVSDEMLCWMRSHLPPEMSGRVVPIKAEETRVPLQDGVADLVVTVTVFHELSDAPATLREALRLLATGGRLLVVDWAKEAAPRGPTLAERVDITEIVERVAEAGFTQVESHDVLPGFSVVTASRP
jgi:ubiquinone/menaquinone biosynthesis C-methylase UbiE